jgi:hypothetical protein
MGTDVPFINDSMSVYLSVGVGMFTDSSLMGTFTLPMPPSFQNVAPIIMISSSTSGSLRFYDPWLVTNPSKVELHGDHMLLMVVDIKSLVIYPKTTDIGQKLHPNKEYDHPTLST